MQKKDSQNNGSISGSKVVAADSVQAEEVPTIPLGSLQTINALQPEVSVHAVTSVPEMNLPSPLVVQPSEYRRSFSEVIHAWWEGIRPAYLILSLVPLVVGSVLAWTQTVTLGHPLGHFHPLRFLAAFIAVALLQIGANLVNDYYDDLRGIDASNQLGPGGLIQQGIAQPAQVLFAGLFSLAIGALVGIVVAFSGGLMVFLFGLIGLLCAYFYSAPSRSLASLSLGELVCFVIFGPLITLGAYMVQIGHIDRIVLIYSIPVGLLSMAIILLNDMRDFEDDAQAGKYTIASLLGLRWSRLFCLLLLLAAYAIIVVLAVPHGAPHILLITLWSLPTLMIVITGMLRTDTPAGLHLVMRQAIKLEAYFGILLVIALIVTALWPLLPHLPTIVLPF
jgi:1,4-dihydroxy-2-naphthoate octaprenyltransferase